VPGLAQGTTYFLQSALQIVYPDTAVITAGWFDWCLSTFAILVGLIPNVINQDTVRWMLRLCAYSTALLLGIYWIWFPIAASRRGGFQPSTIFTTFYNGINLDVDADGRTIVQASDSYCWVIGILFGTWVRHSPHKCLRHNADLDASLCRSSTGMMHRYISPRRRTKHPLSLPVACGLVLYALG
jgi:hypothetical protein